MAVPARVFHRAATKEFGLAVGFLSIIDGEQWLARTRDEAEAGIPDTMLQLDPLCARRVSARQTSASLGSKQSEPPVPA